MGSLLSSIRTPRVLIGDLSELSMVEQKLFSLSYAVLDNENPNIGRVLQSTGTQIISNGSLERNETATSNPGVILPNHIQADGTALISSGDVVLEEQTYLVTHLFCLLITDKPYYFSQTFSQWRSMYQYGNLFSCCLAPKSAIYIAPVGNFPEFIRDFEIKLDSYRSCLKFYTLLQTFAEAFFDGAQIRVLPAVNLFETNWNVKTRLHRITKQKQYFVRDFFVPLKQLKPTDGFCIMGFTWTDLYPTEDLNFVLGEANYTTQSGIFCFGRYEPKTFDPESHSDITDIDAKLLWRILKVFSHELCHLFGMQHCWYFHCAMNESNSMAEAFSQPLFLCPVCLRKLQHVLDFDVVNRYQKLLCFLTDLCVHFPCQEFRQAVHWLQMILKFLKSDIT